MFDSSGSSRKFNKQAQRSRQMITDGLFALMENEKYELITISQICQESGVARQTFYRNFDSKQDIIISCIETRLKDYADKNSFGENFEKNLRILFADYPILPYLLSILEKNGLMYMLEDSCLEFMKYVMERIEIPKLLHSSKYDDFFHSYIVSTVLSILSVWIKHDYKESAEELSAISIQLFRSTAKM